MPTYKYKMGEEFSLNDIIESGKDFSTFELKGYQIEGNMAIHPETQEAILLQDMLNEIRNVRNEHEQIIAKKPIGSIKSCHSYSQKKIRLIT